MTEKRWSGRALAAALALSVSATPVAAALSGAVLFLAATPALAQSGPAISRIDITGNRRIERETVLSYLRLAEGDPMEAGAINEGLKRLYATGLFQDVSITPKEGGVLAIDVTENPIVNEISFEGNRSIDDELLQAQVQSRPRAAFTRARAEADTQTIIDAYRAAGRYSATVEPKIIERGDNRVDLIFEINEGDEVGVSAINFVGNTEYSDRRLRGVVETSESSWWKVFAVSDNYDPDRLEFDKELLRRFYFARGYADFEVTSAVAELGPEREGFFITFTVSEGEQYDVGAVEMTSAVPGVEAEAFTDLIMTDEGDTYDADLVERTVRDVQRRAGEEGVNFIAVRPRAKKNPPAEEGAAPTIDLAYEIVETPRVYVERIEIEGNVRTLDRVIRREFEFVEGDAFNAYRLQESRANIRQLGFFSKVNVATERGSSDDRVVVRTSVEERSTGDISFGVGFSSAESIGGQISLTERNFLGRGQFVKASVSATADRQFYEFRFTEPYFLDRNLRAGVDLYHTEIDNQDESSYDIRKTGFRPRIGFPIDEVSNIDFAYTIEMDDVRGVPANASPLIAADTGSRIVSALGYDYRLDLRDDPNQPTDGLVLNLGQDFAGIGGDAFYVKSEASIKGYKSFFREEVVASLELAGGAVVGLDGADDVKIGDRFSLGGDSFRGFEGSGIGPRDTNALSTGQVNDALGGNYYAMVRADVSFPVGLPEEYGIYGGLFADAGTLWGLDTTTYTSNGTNFSVDDGMELRASAGASIFWSSPFGPIRFNFALPIVKEEEDETEFFRFTAGTRF